MREMKNSHIPFCDTIPENWNEMPNKYLFSEHSSKVGSEHSKYQLLSLTKNGVKEKDINASGGKVPDSYEKYQTVTPGDMIFCLFDLDCSAVFSGLSNYSGMITSAYDVLKPTDKYIDAHFVDYWFQYVFSNRYYKMFSKNIRYTVTSEMFGSIYTPVPDISTQQKIGAILDKKAIQIDTLIVNQEAQIEKLKQYKQSLITEIVTKGLNPNVEMKDSGVEWIGQIPKHWEAIKVKYNTTISRGTFNHRPRNDERLYDGIYPFIQTGDVARAGKYITTYGQTLNEIGKSVSKEFPKGTLTMTIAANIGDVAILNFDAYFPDSVVGFIPNKNCNSNYLYYVFTAMKNEFVRASIVSTQLNLNIERAKELYMPFAPTLDEQLSIATLLDNTCVKLDKMIQLKQSKIARLNEYKKSLIYEYVTGKKEVQ